jgi:Acetyltransferase (GNAT) domain
MAVIALHPVEDGDLDALFEQMRDPEGVRMATSHPRTLTPGTPSTRIYGQGEKLSGYHDASSNLRRAPRRKHRQLSRRGPDRGHLLDRPRGLGKGIATRALALLLELVTARPLYARAASDNAASLRVLHKCGFTAVGIEKSFAAGRNQDTEESILRLDT